MRDEEQNKGTRALIKMMTFWLHAENSNIKMEIKKESISDTIK